MADSELPTHYVEILLEGVRREDLKVGFELEFGGDGI